MNHLTVDESAGRPIFFNTDLRLKLVWMVTAFVPAVTVGASQTFGACILVNTDRLCRVPLLALLR
jgi:hypothetical protein